MDPFSVTVGVVALLETANKVTTALIDRYQAFSSAPRQMSEIADQVTLCAGLVDVFAKSVDGTGQQKFPKKFQEDAASLIKQCHKILEEIEEMIPPGSQKPDYTEKLKYAFGNKKKITKQQDNLKQVQHMLMFMTTCWMYQLPSMQQNKELSSSPSSQIPMGSFQGMMQHMPVQISMKDPNVESAQTFSYEATLTLKPVKPTNLQERIGSESHGFLRGSKPNPVKVMAKEEKIALQNMRRSPYFSAKLLSQPKTLRQRLQPTPEELAKMRLEEHLRVEKDSKQKEEISIDLHQGNPDLVSKEDAELGVDSLISEWFQDGSSDSEAIGKPAKSQPKTEKPKARPRTPSPMAPLRPSPKIVIVNREPSPVSLPPKPPKDYRPYPSPSYPLSDVLSSPPSTRRASWDWACNGCDREYFYEDKRFKCRDCSNFDFCPDCYDNAWHRHPKSRFKEMQERRERERNYRS